MGVTTKAMFGLPVLARAVAVVVVTAVPAVAQSYPSKPVRLIVPFGPGTQSDVLGRLVGQKLTESWGHQVVIENRPGAGAILGTELAAKALPDGYTLMIGGTGALAINPGLYPKLPYDPIKDFAPITKLVIVTQTLVVNPSFAVKSVKALVALAKARPGQLNYGSFGNGSTNHLTTEMFQSAAGIKFGNNVSFRGSADSSIQVMSGELPLMFDSLTAVLPHLKSGKLRGLAVSTATRSPFLPELPTIAESGFPGFEVAGWTGVFAPAKTPDPVLDKINRELTAVLAKPELKEHFNQLAFIAAAGESREDFRRYMLSEISKWSKAIKDSGTKLE